MEKTFQSSPTPCQPTLKASQIKSQRLTHAQRLRKLYELPAPFRTFPLPNFSPHNPLSLLHLTFIWVSQIINPQISHITPAYQGWLSCETRSIHVTDKRSVRGLWEQGFYGKGNLSRSEPNWLDGERARRENKVALTSEEFTRKRRLEREIIKWERARKERFAIDQQLLEEAGALHETINVDNSTSLSSLPETDTQAVSSMFEMKPSIDHIELLTFPNSQSDLDKLMKTKTEQLISIDDTTMKKSAQLENNSCSPTFDSSHIAETVNKSDSSSLKDEPVHNLQEKSVEPLISNQMQGSSVEICEVNEDRKVKNGTLNSFKTFCGYNSSNKTSLLGRKLIKSFLELCKSVHLFSNVNKERPDFQNSRSSNDIDSSSNEISKFMKVKNEEHLQLTYEEAFFLSYALGCLQVLDPTTKARMSNHALFKFCRQNSSFPPKTEKIVSTDDSFMINYVVYHHFRSLGWVVRSGIKFSVDYLLYNRGPVFSHAEFSVLILPSYSHPYWTSTTFLTEYSQRKQSRTWAWLSCINRVISQVKKTLVLCYIDIPPPLPIDEEEQMSLDLLLARYRIREFILSRFLTNRMRA
ncbi:hypothetical protein EPUL_002897 [Erysiphe pulchra]|uniref:tRNA-intron lyase n=1 Tax=Erysiphe pulchra TaxID=225359 RepID=A0A2S4PY65_9PEZI|nr:hypothetical protein EPUL_002897 [Erysiphe pulchra]